MLDLAGGNQPGGIEHKISRQFFLAHLGEMRCVRAVVTAHHEQKVQGHVEQLAQCILSFLSRAADCVEEPKILRRHLRPISIDNGSLNSPLHLLGFTAQHCGLICHTDSLQVHVGIEPRRMRAFELFQERLFVATVPDVFANIIGVGKRQNNKVMALAIAKRTRAGRLGLLVLGFAVNDGGSRFACVFTNPLPDAHHVATGRIDNLATAVLDLLLDRQFRSKRRHDHHVFGPQIGNVGFLVLAAKVLYT